MKRGARMETKKEYLTIGKRRFEVEYKELNQALLKFYPENPRIYSVLDVERNTPDQNEIEKVMCDMEHVKQLKESIKANGGLIDPLIVRDGDFVVLEGNSRLAAYRILNRPSMDAKWGKVKCMLLPSDIDDTAIFTLLGQYHIVGRKDWAPYEQAGYLYRMVKNSKHPIDYIATELGLTKSKATSFVEVYEYMIKNDDNHVNKWSYYSELLKNKKIRKYMSTVDGFEERIAKDIKEDRIGAAIDIRNVLGNIAKVGDKESARIIRDIAQGDYNIYDGHKILEDSGKTGDAFKFLNKFRQKINEKNFRDKVLNGDKARIAFELKQIRKKIEEFSKIIDS